MPWSWCSLPPFVVCLVGFAHLTYSFTISYRWLGLNGLFGFIDALISNYLIFQLFYNYLLSVLTDPGRVPSGWKPDNLSEEQMKEIQEMTTKGTKDTDPHLVFTGVKWCRKCPGWKPPRAHHCSECERCVLKMDHHCPWINNCVGHYNHKYFLLFLISLLFEGIHYTILFAVRIFLMINEFEKPDSDPGLKIDLVLIGIQLVIIVPTVIAVLCLCIYQMQLVSENTTAIESFDKEMEERKAKRKGKAFFFPYDRGACRNFRDVFGSRVSVWLFPTVPETNGFDYKFVTRRPEEV